MGLEMVLRDCWTCSDRHDGSVRLLVLCGIIHHSAYLNQYDIAYLFVSIEAI